MTEAEVVQLYRALLSRDPEDSATIDLFRRYYPTAERGRRAILGSDEFEACFAHVTGRSLKGRDPIAASLALTLLVRAARAAPTPPSPPPDGDVRAGFAAFFAGAPGPRPGLAVAVGDPAGLALDDLAPLGRSHAAVLHVAADFPPVVPLTATLADGTRLFRLGCDAASVADILNASDHRLDALYLLGSPADPGWVDTLRPHFAARTLLVVGRTHATFDTRALSDAIAAAHPAEPVQPWRGLHLHHYGGWLLPVTYAPPPPPPPPDRTGYPKLAIAAIVRDEAVCVVNMLRSTLPVASFYAVLDTGSADDTQARAEAFLSSHDVPHAVATRDHASFGDHFGDMRNAALAMVPDWIDWVLMLDADEEIAAEDCPAVLELIAGGSHDAYALPRYNFPGADTSGEMLSYPDRQTRLLRHTPDGRIGYSGAVHEKVQGIETGQPPLDGAAIGGARGGPHIHHLVRRFRTPEQEARKQAFYRDVARRHGS